GTGQRLVVGEVKNIVVGRAANNESIGVIRPEHELAIEAGTGETDPGLCEAVGVSNLKTAAAGCVIKCKPRASVVVQVTVCGHSGAQRETAAVIRGASRSHTFALPLNLENLTGRERRELPAGHRFIGATI